MIEVGSYVGWKWGNGFAEGEVVEVHHEKTTITTKGASVTRNGTADDPALIIEQDSGTRVLKLAHEVTVATS